MFPVISMCSCWNVAFSLTSSSDSQYVAFLNLVNDLHFSCNFQSLTVGLSVVFNILFFPIQLSKCFPTYMICFIVAFYNSLKEVLSHISDTYLTFNCSGAHFQILSDLNLVNYL